MSFLTELTGDGLHCKRVAPDDTLAISASAVRQSQLLSSRLLKNGPHCRWRVRLSQRERMGEKPSTSHCARDGSFSLGEKVRMRVLQQSLGIDRFEAGKHFRCFRQGIERNAIAHVKEFFPHGEDVRIFVRGIDRLARFPFRYFDDCAITRAHNGRSPIRYKSFLAQSWNATSHQLKKVVFLTGFWPVSDDDTNARHEGN